MQSECSGTSLAPDVKYLLSMRLITPKTTRAKRPSWARTTLDEPQQGVSYRDMLEMITALRAGFREACTAVLEESQKMESPPPVGNRWPRYGFQLPYIDTFRVKRDLSFGPTVHHLPACS